MSASDELRELLRSTEYGIHGDLVTPVRSEKPRGAETNKQELESLLSSLDNSLRTPTSSTVKTGGGAYTGGLSASNLERLNVLASANKSSPRAAMGASISFSESNAPPPVPMTSLPPRSKAPAPAETALRENSKVTTPLPPTSKGSRPDGAAQQKPALTDDVDEADITVLRFHTELSLRTNAGWYVCALPGGRDSANSSSNFGGNGDPYELGMSGQGTGDPLDCLMVVPVSAQVPQMLGSEIGVVPGEGKNAPLRYGMTVAIRAPAAKERHLGLRDGKLGFWRPLIGSAEQWTIIKGANGVRNMGHSLVGTKILEEPSSRGTYIRQGDRVLLYAGSSSSEAPASLAGRTSRSSKFDDEVLPEQLLTLHEDLDGGYAKLIHKDRHSGLGNEFFQIDCFGAQTQPVWTERPYLSQHFLTSKRGLGLMSADILNRTFPDASAGVTYKSDSNVSANLLALSPLAQQSFLVREVLLALAGVAGQFIHISTGSSAESSSRSSLKDIEFDISEDIGIDRAVVSQITQLLPICRNAVIVREFIRQQSRQSYGSVSHSLSASIRIILREYDVLVAQLEHQFKTGKLSLQRLVFLVQPSEKVLRLLSSVCLRLWDKSGGALLNIMHELLLEQGDDKNKELVLHLFQQSVRPFLKLLSNWIFRGELDDPYREFMIQEDKSVTRDVAAFHDDFTGSYWENRLSLVDENVPKFLKSIAPRVLTAGKYLNVVRSCIERGNTGDVAAVEGDGSATALIAIVERAYVYSSRSLLKLLESGHKLRSHLKSLSRFFLLEHGDFFIQFMDIAEEDLRNEVKLVNKSRVQNLLQTALSTSTLASDPNKDLLSCDLAKSNLIQHLYLIQSAGGMDGASAAKEMTASQGLKGVEALTLDYEVKFPVSLVLSKRAMAKYKLLSRLLYFSKHVELRLLSCWVDHQSTKELDIAQGGQGAYLLRQRMTHFIHNFVYYMGLEVIGPRSHEMHQGLQVAVDTDEVLALHERFLDTCLTECLLSSQDQLRNLTKIMTTCLLFADHMAQFNDNSFVTLKIKVGSETITIAEHRDTGAQRRARLTTQSKYMSREMGHQSFKRILAKFYETFDAQVGDFLESLWADSYKSHPQLANLCTRLDYNGFYSSKLTSGNG
eukprot:GSChrysophyteH1.ASY1.ANO1.3089.1 assembled CDS